MAQKIMLTSELIDVMIAEFAAQLRAARVTTSSFVYTKKLTGYTEKANLIYSPMAWLKQRLLVDSVDKEIAWYGLMERREADTPTYYVKDIVVYPQKTTAVTVDVDDEIYPEWYGSQPDEFYTEMRLQGHSHVSMPTSPSGTDRDHWDELIQKVPSDSFFVCIVTNKKMEHYVNIFDFRLNTKFESSDVSISVDGFCINDFLKDVKDKLTSIPTPTYASSKYSGKSTVTGRQVSGFGSSGIEDDCDWYDDGFDYYNGRYVYSSPATAGKPSAQPPKSGSIPASPKTTAFQAPPKTSAYQSPVVPAHSQPAPTAPAPKGNVPHVSPSAYTSKFGKRG